MRLTAVAAMVVLALTGFSTGRGGHSRGHGSGGSGGGCSSSSQNHDSSSHSSSSGGSSGSYGSSGSGGSTYDDDDDVYGSGTSGSSGGGYTRRPGYRSTPSSSASGGGSARQYGKARLVRCASTQRPYATVEVRSLDDRTGTYTVSVTFRDARDTVLDQGMAEVKVRGKGKATVKVPVDVGEGLVSDVARCEVDPEAWPSDRT